MNDRRMTDWAPTHLLPFVAYVNLKIDTQRITQREIIFDQCEWSVDSRMVLHRNNM